MFHRLFNNNFVPTWMQIISCSMENYVLTETQDQTNFYSDKNLLLHLVFKQNKTSCICYFYLYVTVLICIFKVIIVTKSLTSLLYIWICKVCKRKACHVCRRDGESGIRGWMWPVLIKSPGRWRWREVLWWLKGCFRTNETISCLGHKGWLWRREVIIPLKTPTLGKKIEEEEKSSITVMSCKVTQSCTSRLEDCIKPNQNL